VTGKYERRWPDLTETPKHFTAIAASKNTAAFGNVSCDIAKKEDRLCGAFAAQRDRRYNPKAATDPENIQVRTPGMIPAEARDYQTMRYFYSVDKSGPTNGNVNIPTRSQELISHLANKIKIHLPLPIIVFDRLLTQLVIVA
jgi:hypothetical protein